MNRNLFFKYYFIMVYVSFNALPLVSDFFFFLVLFFSSRHHITFIQVKGGIVIRHFILEAPHSPRD